MGFFLFTFSFGCFFAFFVNIVAGDSEDLQQVGVEGTQRERQHLFSTNGVQLGRDGETPRDALYNWGPGKRL